MRLDLTTKRWSQQYFRPYHLTSEHPNTQPSTWSTPIQRSGEELLAHFSDYKDQGWLPVRIPGDVRHSYQSESDGSKFFIDRITDQWEWINHQEWWLRCRIRFPRHFHYHNGKVQLCVNGVTAPASIWFNCEHLGDVTDATRRIRFELPGPIDTQREHLLAVRIDPTLLTNNFRRAPMYDNHPYSGDPSWPSLSPIGFWDDLWIEAVPMTRIEGADLKYQLHGDFDRVSLSVRLHLDSDFEINDRIRLHFNVIDLETGKSVMQIEGSAPWQSPTKPVELTWPNPKLWWPCSLGHPAMYRLDCELKVEDLSDRWSTRFGLRTVEFTDDSSGNDRKSGPSERTEYRIAINRQPIYLRSAYWMPPNLLHTCTQPEQYDGLLRSARAAGINTIRLWSGAPLERSAFYSRCDELGLMVWQEIHVPSPSPQEKRHPSILYGPAVSDTVQRLRYHPSVAFWTQGDGRVPTVKTACITDDPADLYLPEATTTENHLVDDVTGAEVENLAKQSIYIPPYQTAQMTWNVGCEGPPRLPTILRSISEPNRWPLSQVMEHHAIRYQSYGDVGFMADSLEEWHWAASLWQAVRLQTLIERERSRLHSGSGITLWRWNEPWPSGSFGLVDDDGTPKVAYYWLKRVMQPVAVMILDEGPLVPSGRATAKIAVQNQSPKTLPPLDLELHWLSIDETLNVELLNVERIPTGGQTIVTATDHPIPAYGFILLRARLLYKKRPVAETTHPYTSKDWELLSTALHPVKADAGMGGGKCKVKAVGRPLICVEIPGDIGAPYADNYFTLTEGEEREIQLFR